LIPAASTTKTTTASVDGRTVSATRWNAPQLLVGGNFSASTVPNWILMDRVGIAPSQTFNATNFTNRTPNNDRFIIGRFAYNIYDVSGLLDINVAGYPSGVTTADSARKGNLAMAALENIPGITSAANASLFVKDWRNKVTGTTATNFLSFLGLGNATANPYYNFGPKYGFQKVANSASDSDNRILSRQDLIKLANNGNFGISTAALPYLTHFSRAVSAPSWSPPTPTGSSINYNADRNLPGSANRFLPNVRVPSSGADFTRADGTKAQQGEPLLKTRFPLSRLALIQKDANPSTPALDLTPEIVAFVKNFEDRRIANGGSALEGVTINQKAAWLVQLLFGLTWSSDKWIYAGPTGSTAQSSIATLGSISGREPNFFELLKASILSGSLGRDAGPSALNNSENIDDSTDGQIIKIGVNIIDQYDADSYPTKINFDGGDYVGIENLPYLNRLISQYYRDSKAPVSNRAYFLLELFNPHRPKANTDAPIEFRVKAAGRVRIAVGSVEDQTKAPWVYGYPGFMPADPSRDGNANPRNDDAFRNTDSSITPPATLRNGLKYTLGIQLNTSTPLTFQVPLGSTNLYTWPTLLTQRVAGVGVGTSGSSSNKVDDGPVKFVGFYAGQVTCSTATYGNYRGSWNPCYGAMMYTDNTTGPLSFTLEYKASNGSWVNFCSWENVRWGDWDGGGNRRVADATSPAIYFQAADPRSSRFGLFLNYCHQRTSDPAMVMKNHPLHIWVPPFPPGPFDPSWTGPIYQDSLGMTSRPDSTATADTVFSLPYGVPFQQAGAPPAAWGPSSMATNPDGTPSYRFGCLAENKTTLANEAPSPTYYRDKDNILRNGDAAYASGAWGQPLEQANSAAGLASRPVILDRPFRSVAEMGYAFRDLPFKSLDFFTEFSADAALLDVFSVNESPVTGVTAGVLNPNTPHQPVLKAVLANAFKNELDASSNIAVSEAENIAGEIKKTTTESPITPIKNVSELATRITSSKTLTNAFSDNGGEIKTRRESVVRALADVSNTRTWNLLVDLVMQSGRYATGATTVDRFSVDGERRYWLHLAIDRYTGQVVARSMEPVNE
jgi:hypothetical protein